MKLDKKTGKPMMSRQEEIEVLTLTKAIVCDGVKGKEFKAKDGFAMCATVWEDDSLHNVTIRRGNAPVQLIEDKHIEDWK